METERGMLDLAESDYGEALVRDPQNKDYMLARAKIRLKLGKLTDAKSDLDTLVKSGTPRGSLQELYKRCRIR